MNGNNQVGNVIALLGESPASRHAVIQLFDAADIAEKHKDIPCTCTLQFMLRRGRLQMFTNMRSDDAFLGLPHDVFAFTMLQEIVARTLCVELGTYKHAVGSLHLYERDKQKARQYLQEGWQPTTESMPAMPMGDPWSSIVKVLTAERAIRLRGAIDISALNLDPYWTDLVRLLQIYWHYKKGERNKIARLKRTMSVRVYDPYIEKKKRTVRK